MSLPAIAAIPLSVNLPVGDKKKKVLLVDMSSYSRDLRAEAMRKRGMDVDCAADIAEARSWWRANLYDLVLISAENGRGHRDRFCEDIRAAKPPQRMAFLVGEPAYLADSPSEQEPLTRQNSDHQAMAASASAALVISTKPKPRERPVSRSVTSVIFSTAPCGSKTFRSSDSVVLWGRLPT